LKVDKRDCERSQGVGFGTGATGRSKKGKGYLLITNRYAGYLHPTLLELSLKSVQSPTGDSVAFNLQPWISAQIRIGSSRQYGAEASSLDSEMLPRMLGRVQCYLPGLGKLSTIRTGTGFRAATPGRVSYLGPWLEDKTILLATQHEGLGIVTAPGTGQLVAVQRAGTKSQIPVEPYFPAIADERMYA